MCPYHIFLTVWSLLGSLRRIIQTSVTDMRQCQLMGEMLDCMMTKIPVPKILYFKHIHLHTQIPIFNTVLTVYTTSTKELPNYLKGFKQFHQIILCYSTLLKKYVDFITANPKVLHMAGSVSVRQHLRDSIFFL